MRVRVWSVGRSWNVPTPSCCWVRLRSSSGSLKMSAPNIPSVLCVPVWEWYQKVPVCAASNMYLKLAPGEAPHCVTCSTPSMKFVFLWSSPCQCIETKSASSLFVTFTLSTWPWLTIMVGPGKRPLMAMMSLKVYPSAVYGSVQLSSSPMGPHALSADRETKGWGNRDPVVSLNIHISPEGAVCSMALSILYLVNVCIADISSWNSHTFITCPSPFRRGHSQLGVR